MGECDDLDIDKIDNGYLVKWREQELGEDEKRQRVRKTFYCESADTVAEKVREILNAK